MRRHVLGVRRGRRDAGIALRRVEALLGDRRIVIEVDQVVRDAGMARLPLEDRLEDFRALELIGVGLVGRRGADIERDGIEDLRFVVVGIALRQRLHRLEIGLHAGAMIDLVVVGVEDEERVDEIALARRLGADGLCLLQRGEAGGEIFRRRRGVRVVEERKRDAPQRDAA